MAYGRGSKDLNPVVSLETWKRPIRPSILSRFLPGAKLTDKLAIDCPECQQGTVVDHSMYDSGDGAIEYLFPQCAQFSGHAQKGASGQNHGYGPFSRHRTFRDNTSRKGRGRRDYVTPSAPVAVEPTIPSKDPNDGGRDADGPLHKDPDPVVSVDPPAVAVDLATIPVANGVNAKLGRVVHPQFATVVTLHNAGARSFLLEGPAGTGKSTIARDLAEYLGLPLTVLTGSANADESEIIGGRNPVSGVWRPSELAIACQQPGVTLLDELDGYNPSVAICLNLPLANRVVTVDGRLLPVHPDHVFVATANATNGATRQYTGRFPCDGATKDRFYPVFCDYSPEIDALVCADVQIRNRVETIRVKVNNDPVLAKTMIVGTRFLQRCATTGQAYGLKGAKAVDKFLSVAFPPSVLAGLV